MVEGSARRIAAIPFDTRSRHPGLFLADAKAGLDFIVHNLPRAHDLLERVNPYPRPWARVDVPCRDGAALAGWYGPGKPGGPSILFLPGTFQTKDDTPRKRRAIRLWRDLGAHVLIVDLRGFGGSHHLMGTAGHREALDAHDAAAWLQARSGAARVHLWGESLGGAVALRAASLPGAGERFAQVLAWSPFADLARASKVASRRERTLIARAYRWLLRVRTNREVEDFEQYLGVCARELGVDLASLMRECSPLHHAGALQVPALVFHAEDDPVVPVDHARMLEACGAPNLTVHILPHGRHLDFDLRAPRWFAQVTKGLLS